MFLKGRVSEMAKVEAKQGEAEREEGEAERQTITTETTAEPEADEAKADMKEPAKDEKAKDFRQFGVRCLSQVERRVSDRKMLKLIRAWLRVGVLENGVITDPVSGAPQGSPVSPCSATSCSTCLIRRGDRWGRAWGRWSGFATTSSCSPRAGPGQKRPRLGSRRSWSHSGCICTPTRPGSPASPRARMGLSSWASSIVWSSPGSIEVVGISTNGRRLGPWPQSGPRSESARAGVERAGRWAWSSKTSTPCCGDGGTTFVMATRRWKLQAVDGYVHLRMARLASTKHGLHGRNWATRFTHGWLTDLGMYRLSGTRRYLGAASA